MKGETRRYGMRRGTAVAAKREILGKTYLVIVYPPRDNGRRKVFVYANTVDGRDDGFPQDLFGAMECDYEKIAKHEFRHGDESSEVAKAVNKAVATLEEHINSTADTEDSVLDALDANKEVHENE